MAIAKLVCGDCGGVLSQSDNFCPQCGARIERTAFPVVSPDSSADVNALCVICGGHVDPRASFCESCGATLKPSTPPTGDSVGESSRPQDVQQQKSPKKATQSQRKGKRESPRFETWQLIVGGVILALVTFFMYKEISREPAPVAASVQENFPSQPSLPLQDIEAQQAKVDANPKDGALLIRLANMLHDAALHDSRFLMRAINTYSQYLELNPDDPDARVDKGICYFEMARVDTNNTASLLSKAIQEMQRAITSNPDHQPAAFNLGIVNLNAGNLEESAKWFKRTVVINPNSELGKRAQQLLEQHSPIGSSN